MHGHRPNRTLWVLLATTAVFAAGISSAQGGNGPAFAAECATSQRHGPPARAAAPRSYDDYIEDVVSAPDICAANLVTNDNVAVTIAIHAHDRSRFDSLDSYSVLLDTDSNPGTGAGADEGAAAGAEFVIDIFDVRSQLSAWNGTSFAPVAPQPEIPTVWIEDYGPALQVERAALGSPHGFNLTLRTANGTDLDLAPDTGSWSYTVTPLRLTPGKLMLGAAQAGKPLVAGMMVERSDFEIPLAEGKIACSATLAGKKLAGRASFVADMFSTCTWRLPRSARGKRVQGSMAVTFQGVTARRAFAVRVK